MPRLSDATRAQRRQHILTSAWTCFSRDGFHATSMDDIIAATGMSSSAVYRYFRSKEQIIRASAEEGVVRVREIFVALLDHDPCPDPAETLTLVVAELHRRSDNPDYDMTRLALQTWAETLRDPVLHHRVRQLFVDTLEHIAELAQRWCDNGFLPPDADTKAVAASFLSIMQGLIVMHHVVDDVPAHTLRTGVALLGAATRIPAPTSTRAKKAAR
jgi:AcrR family transcriptional regulator